MSRVKSSSVNNKHKKVLSYVKGFIGRRKNSFKISNQAYIKSLIYSKRDRRKKRSIERSKYISYINLFLSRINLKYSVFINLLFKYSIFIDRKIFYFILKKKEFNVFFYKILNRIGR
ncbi:MAG: 50S ribosomal protein L20 [Candidatus Vidania fulgoroideorum]